MKPNILNPDRVVTHLAPEVTSGNIDKYRKVARPKAKRMGELPVHSYEGIKHIDSSSGKTYWRDGTVTQWTFDKAKDENDPTPSTDRERWTARVESYWSTYPYRCSICWTKGGQRPKNPNRGYVRLYRLDQWILPDGSESFDDLAALCKPCHSETLEHSRSAGTTWLSEVARYEYRHKRERARRRRTITQQAQQRAHLRARRAERDAEWAEHIRRWDEEGISIPWPEMHAKYSDIPKPVQPPGPKPAKPTGWTDH